MKSLKEILEASLLGDIDDTLSSGDDISKVFDEVKELEELLKPIQKFNQTHNVRRDLNDVFNTPLEKGDIVLVYEISYYPVVGIVNRYLRSKKIEVFCGLNTLKDIDIKDPYKHLEKHSVESRNLYLLAKAKDSKKFISKL